MTKPTDPKGDLTTLNHLVARVRDLEMLFQFANYEKEELIDYLVIDYSFCRDELTAKSTLDIWGEIELLQSEYGLAFDYVKAGTFEDQNTGYFRYQLSYGGPAEEIRFYVDPEHNLMKAEFWLLDWFTGSYIDCTNQETIKAVWQLFKDVETSKHAYEKSMNSN